MYCAIFITATRWLKNMDVRPQAVPLLLTGHARQLKDKAFVFRWPVAPARPSPTP